MCKVLKIIASSFDMLNFRLLGLIWIIHITFIRVLSAFKSDVEKGVL